MINCIIVDDEKHCIQKLQSVLEDTFSNQVLVLDSFSNVSSALKGIEMLQPELLFLDVEIGKESGFQLLEQLNHSKINVIFTTAYDKFAVQAFKYSAVDYLLKPIDKEELAQAIQKIVTKLDKEINSKKIEALLYNLTAQNLDRKICLPDTNGITLLKVSEIISCQSESNYTIIHKIDKTKMVVSKTLKEIEDMLTGAKFFRVHHSFLVNMNYIKNYNKGKGGSVTMIDGREIEVATRRKEEFLIELGKG